MAILELDAIDDLLTALADPTRRRILDRVAAHGSCSASVLSREMPVTRQAVVQHLAVLEGAALVSSQRAGRERRYVVRPEQLTVAANWMNRMAAQWDTRLAEIARIAEALPQAPQG